MHDDKLKSLLEKRDKIQNEISKIEAKKEMTEKALADLEQEIRAKGIEPKDLAQRVLDLKAAYDAEVLKFQQSLLQAEEAIKPYKNL